MPAGRISSDEKKNKVLLVAIDYYLHQKPLQNAVRDVLAFKDLLIENYGYQSSDFITCLNEAATREGIFTALRELVKESKGMHNVIIYFSGHGQYDSILEAGSWVTHESNNMSDDITSGAITQTFIRLIKSKHIFLIVDACFSGSLFSQSRKVVSEETNYLDKLEALKSRYAMTSGRSDQEVPDGPPGGHSPFAALLLNYLNSQRSSASSVVDLIQHVQSSIEHNYPQQPLGGPLFGVGHENGEMIFRRSDINIDSSEGEQSMEDIDTFCFSLCKTDADFRRYLVLFPNGKFKKQAESYILPVEMAVGAEPNVTNDKDAVTAHTLDSVIEKMMDEDSPKLDEAIDLSANWHNMANQTAQGVMPKEEFSIKESQFAEKVKELSEEFDAFKSSK